MSTTNPNGVDCELSRKRARAAMQNRQRRINYEKNKRLKQQKEQEALSDRAAVEHTRKAISNQQRIKERLKQLELSRKRKERSRKKEQENIVEKM